MPDRIYYSQEAERIAKRNRIVNILLFMALGLGLGAVVAILFAPDEGEKTRRLIADAVEEGFKRGVDATQDALGQIEVEFPDLDLRKRVDGILSNIRR